MYGLPWDKIFRVGDEFRIRASAQLIEVHALAFSFDGHAEGANAIQGPVQAIGERQNEAEQRGHAHQLSQPLSWRPAACYGQRTAANIQDRAVKASKKTDREDAPNASYGVNGNRASRIVHFQTQLEPLHRKG